MQTSQLEKRLKKLEKHDFENTATIIEILSNITFFGGMRRDNCVHAKEGQCGLFLLRKEAKKRIPIATDCRIKGCKSPSHCHLELSNLVCAFCGVAVNQGK